MQRVEFSKGFEARVYLAEAADREICPDAQIVKKVISIEKSYGEYIFLGNLIATALLPEGSLLPILGVHTKNTSLEEHPGFVQSIYSRLANVSTDHATYASHMEVIDRNKKSTCKCAACKDHHMKHRVGNYSKIAKELGIFALSEFGVLLPYTDPSDYCLTAGGNILFFETDNIIPHQVANYLDKNPDVNRSTNIAGVLERYKRILYRNQPSWQ